MKAGDKSTLHFDSTLGSKVDEDWLCLIPIFSNKQQFSLRPLFLAYEDRENIVHLIVETYESLLLTLSVDEQVITPQELWVKTTTIMTDSK